MTTKTYKSYTVQIVGLSHHIFRPGVYEKVKMEDGYAPSFAAAGFAMSMAEAKRWINTDIHREGKGDNSCTT